MFGNTKPIKENLKKLGGRFNGNLTHNGEKIPGWIFKVEERKSVQALLAGEDIEEDEKLEQCTRKRKKSDDNVDDDDDEDDDDDDDDEEEEEAEEEYVDNEGDN